MRERELLRRKTTTIEEEFVVPADDTDLGDDEADDCDEKAVEEPCLRRDSRSPT